MLALLTLFGTACGGGTSASAPQRAAVSRPTGNVYPGDGATKTELAGWMGAAALASGLPPELPVMAALVESNVQNLAYGDADSVGYFQIPVRIWNKAQYAGFPDKPELQLKWFIDQALAAGRRRATAGVDGKDENTWGEWIADVERPAPQYRGRYQLRLEEARRLLRG